MLIWNINIETVNTEQPCRSTTWWGSLMHGMLMEHLPVDWQNELHVDGIRPFSQWVEGSKEGCFVWHLCVYDEALCNVVTKLIT